MALVANKTKNDSNRVPLERDSTSSARKLFQISQEKKRDLEMTIIPPQQSVIEEYVDADFA